MLVTINHDGRKVSYQADADVQRIQWLIEDIMSKNVQLQLAGAPDSYALKMPGDTGEYLSDQNFRMFLREGVELLLKLAPQKEASEAVFALQSGDDVRKKKTIFSLSKQFADTLFAKEFVRKSGTAILVDFISKNTGNNQAYALLAMQSLMNQEVEWNTFGVDFVDQIVSLIANPSSVTTCRYATAILMKIVVSGPGNPGLIRTYGFAYAHEAMKRSRDTYAKVIERISDNDLETQMNSLMLLNAMFQNAQGPYFGEFMDKLDLNTRKAIMRLMQSNQKEDVGRELMTFQRLYYKELLRQQKIAIDRSKPEHATVWNEITQAAEVGPNGATALGFRSNAIEQDLASVGFLGLSNMAYFARKNKDFFAKFVLEQNARNDGKRCPVAVASIEVTRALVEHFRVVNDEYANRCPTVIAFEEMYVVAIQGLFKMWTEMQASESDMSKVVALVRTQLEFTSKDPEATIDQYRNALVNTPVKEVQERRLQALEAGDEMLMKLPMRNLRERVHKEVFEFVRDQRVSVLLGGAFFATYTLKGRTRNSYRYYKLSPNKKYLHYAEFTEPQDPKPTIDKLQERIELSGVAELAVAGQSPMFQDKRKVSDEVPVALTFSLVGHDGASLADLVAENATQYAEWTDGLRVVLGKTLAAGSATRDTLDLVETLTDFEVKIKLMQIRLAGINIPDEAPAVPPPPPSYDFLYSAA